MVKHAVECVLEQVIFMTEMPLLLRRNNHWLFAMERIAHPCSSSKDGWNRSLHYDWKIFRRTNYLLI